MKNELKAYLYELKYSKFVFKIFFLIGVFTVMLTLFASEELCGNLPVSASSILAESSNVFYLFSLMIAGVLTGLLCGDDMRDKVINYEVMSGHSRLSIFAVRSLMTVILSSLLMFLITAAPLIVSCIAFGWGDTMELKHVLVRFILMIFPYIRFGAFMVLIVYLTKSPYPAMVVGLIYSTVCGFISGIAGTKSTFTAAYYNLVELLSFRTRTIYGINMKDGIVQYSAYESAVESGLIINTIWVSLLMAFVFLAAAYGLFRRDDLK